MVRIASTRKAARRAPSTSCRIMQPYFLQQLKETPDGDGTMLDNSVVIYGSPMGNPNQHNHKRVPFLVAGHAGGAIKGGVHLKAKNQTPLSNVMLSLLHSV